MHQQYDDAIRDLLGIDTQPSLSISADEKLAAFYSDSVSPRTRLSVEQYAGAAEEVARAAVEQKLDSVVGCIAGAQNEACADQFIQSFGQRAFRRPLAAEETARY